MTGSDRSNGEAVNHGPLAANIMHVPDDEAPNWVLRSVQMTARQWGYEAPRTEQLGPSQLDENGAWANRGRSIGEAPNSGPPAATVLNVPDDATPT